MVKLGLTNKYGNTKLPVTKQRDRGADDEKDRTGGKELCFLQLNPDFAVDYFAPK